MLGSIRIRLDYGVVNVVGNFCIQLFRLVYV